LRTVRGKNCGGQAIPDSSGKHIIYNGMRGYDLSLTLLWQEYNVSLDVFVSHE